MEPSEGKPAQDAQGAGESEMPASAEAAGEAEAASQPAAPALAHEDAPSLTVLAPPAPPPTAPMPPAIPPPPVGPPAMPPYRPPPGYPTPGYAPPHVYAPPRTAGAPSDARAMIALLAAIGGIVLSPLGIPGLTLGPIAYFLGKSAVGRIDAARGALGGRGTASAAWMLGVLATVLGAVSSLGWFVYILLAISGTPPSS